MQLGTVPYREAWDLQSPAGAGAWNNLGSVLAESDAAVGAYGRAVALKEAALGPDHRSIAITLDNLAVKERRRGRLEVEGQAMTLNTNEDVADED